MDIKGMYHLYPVNCDYQVSLIDEPGVPSSRETTAWARNPSRNRRLVTRCRVIGDSTGRLDPLLPDPIWQAGAHTNPLMAAVISCIFMECYIL